MLCIYPANALIFRFHMFIKEYIYLILCSRRHVYVKSENKGMCCGICIVLVNGKFAKNATMDPVLFFVLQPKIHNLYSSTRVIGMSTREKELGITQGYLCIFGPHNRFLSKMRKSRNDQCHAHFLQTKFQKRKRKGKSYWKLDKKGRK